MHAGPQWLSLIFLKMKIFLRISDYTIAVLMGVGTLFLVSLIVGKDWNMFFAMLVGMILGIVVLLLTVMIFSSISTAFELFPVGMIITMFTGMASGMILTKTETISTPIFVAVMAFSLFAQIGIDLYNMKLKGDVPLDR
jgi:hypothetical protein